MRPYRHIPFIATAIAALVCPLARAEELPASGPLPLGDVVAYARAHNPELEAAHQRQAAARAVPAQAAAWDDPTLAAESWNSPRAVPYDGADNNILKLSQRLPFPGKLGLKGRMAERDADMAAADARMTELTVLESVKQAYWDLWLTDRHLAVYTRDLELARELAAGAAGRYAVGMGGQPDVLRAEVERTHIATRLVTTRLERERAAARLNELLSRGPEEPLGTPVDPGPAHLPGPLDRLLARGLRGRQPRLHGAGRQPAHDRVHAPRAPRGGGRLREGLRQPRDGGRGRAAPGGAPMSRPLTLVILATLASPAFAVDQPAELSRAPIRLDAAQQQAIGLTWGTAERRPVEKVIRTVGRLDFDERKLAQVTLKVGGYIEELYANYTGQPVRKGDPLFTLYSPELLTAQREYLLARETERRLRESSLPEARASAASLVRASRERLRLWDLSPQQLRELEESGQARRTLTVHAPIAGVVIEKMAVAGMRVEPGATLYKLADLSTIWAYGDVYEHELPFVKVGQEADLTLAAYPEQAFTARVAWVSPVLDAKTRTVRVRFELPNSPDQVLRPEMYGTVEVRVPLGDRLVVPRTAVLDSGRRQVVFADGGDGRLVPREVRLGGRFDDAVEVLDGVAAGERVVTSANFLVDSESKLQAAESMMGMMGALGMGHVTMEGARPMQMGGEAAAP